MFMRMIACFFRRADPDSRNIFLPVLAVLLVLLNLCVYLDWNCYRTPIAKVVSAQITHTQTVSGDLGIDERQYDQLLSCVVLNGKDKGKTAAILNTYTDTHMDGTAYHKGNFLFLENIKAGNDGTLQAAISGQKRDYFLSFLLSLLLFGAVVVAGKRGFAFFFALAVNLGILVLGFFCFQTGLSFALLTVILILLFSTLSLGICIGWNRQMLVALMDTLVSIGILAAVYCLVLVLGPDVDYTLQEYIRNGTLQLEVLFTCGILLGSLGAIMDVAVSVTSGVAEILEKEPGISNEFLSQSVRQIGYDVMGTMINVLFYTYLAGRIPIYLAQLANGVRLDTLFQYYIVYEILRFLAGALGIVLCIPISSFLAIHYYRKKAPAK
ncbi:hypothetical protein OBV_15320 [Oscillibacter valericigenes Sjm18-20]|nr:hypothetical protein OBV_05980 [Oscillibacter valericigenes Sjm18-20]BAK98730.1 hypothetical protein OBV_15320 [Oscillibacter valericigenes Sjm18-20]